MSTSPIKVGFVGLSARRGWASAAHGPALSSLSDVYTLTAVSTSSPESASQSAKKFTDSTGYPVKAYHGTSDGISSDSDVELVAVAVKAPDHKKMILPAINAGKHVFLEWPAGANLAQTMEFAEAARRKGIRSMVGLQSRQSPALKKVQELLGEIGQIRSTTIMHMIPRAWSAWGPQIQESLTWIQDPTAGGSMATVVLGHFLDGFLQTFGDFEYVSSTAEISYPMAKVIRGESYTAVMDGKTASPAEEAERMIRVTSPDHVAVTGKLKSGAIASIIFRGGMKTTEGRRGFLWEIDGEDGSIRVEGSGLFGHSGCSVYLNGKLVQEPQDGEMLKSITAAWREFAKENGNYPTLDDAVKVHRLLEDIKRSGIEGRRVYVQ